MSDDLREIGRTKNKQVKLEENWESNPQAVSRKWWLMNKEEVYKSVFSHVSFIDSDQAWRTLENDRLALLYNNRSLLRFTRSSRTSALNSIYPSAAIKLNVIASATDTVTAKVAKSKVKVQFVTDHANYKDRQKAQDITDYVYSVFYNNDLYSIMPQVFTDAAVFGVGVLGVNAENNQINFEHVLLDEIRVDEYEAIYGKPRTLYRKKVVDKDQLVATFATDENGKVDTKLQELIYQSGSSALSNTPYDIKQSNMAIVVEAWHLPSKPGAKDGARSISLDNCTLLNEEYHKDYFPFVFLHWGTRPTIGFYSNGLAYSLAGIQYELNILSAIISKSMRLFAVPRIMVENSSEIATGGSVGTNEIGTIVRYTGTKPDHWVPSFTLPNDLFSYFWNLYQKAYELAGVSQMNASGTKPAGLDSGEAIREYNDIGSERFAIIGQNYEEAFRTAAKIVVDLTKDVLEAGGDIDTMVVRDGSAVQLKASDLSFNTKYTTRINSFPIAMMPSTPVGKTQLINEYIKSGWISQEEGMEYIGIPDTGHIVDIHAAKLNYAEAVTDGILEKGIWVEPDNFMDLALTIQIGHAKLLKERIDSPKNQNLVLMERFLQAAMDLDSANKAAQAPAQPAPNSPAGGPAAPVPHVQGGPPTVNQAMAPKGGEFTTNKIKQ